MTEGTYEGPKNSSNKPHGIGTFKWAEGTSYHGEFRHGQITGRGTYRWPDGNVYYGDFVNSMKSGKGTFVWKNGDIFQGEFKDGKISGVGTFWYSNGNRYRGGVVEGYRQGQGILYDNETGAYFDCNFDRGEPKSGTWVLQGNMYKGPFVNGIFGGRGTYSYPSGTSKIGNFRDGALDESSAKILPDYVPVWSIPEDFYTAQPESVDIIPQRLLHPPAIPKPILPPKSKAKSEPTSIPVLSGFNEPPKSPSQTSPKSNVATPVRSALPAVSPVSPFGRRNDEIPVSPPKSTSSSPSPSGPSKVGGGPPPPPPPPAGKITIKPAVCMETKESTPVKPKTSVSGNASLMNELQSALNRKT